MNLDLAQLITDLDQVENGKKADEVFTAFAERLSAFLASRPPGKCAGVILFTPRLESTNKALVLGMVNMTAPRSVCFNIARHIMNSTT